MVLVIELKKLLNMKVTAIPITVVGLLCFGLFNSISIPYGLFNV